jgi:hypothetical protein
MYFEREFQAGIMLNADVLVFQEFVTREPLPLSKIHGAVLEFLQGRDDVALFEAQAVNAYSPEPRMTQDVDIMSTRGREFADELRQFISDKFHIAVRVREVAEGKGFRIFQIRKEDNRHLFDVRSVATIPQFEIVEDINVLSPPELIASKVTSYQSRRGKPKSGTDWRDLATLLLRFPELKSESGKVSQILVDAGADESTLAVWRELVSQELTEEDDDLNF